MQTTRCPSNRPFVCHVCETQERSGQYAISPRMHECGMLWNSGVVRRGVVPVNARLRMGGETKPPVVNLGMIDDGRAGQGWGGR